jgi:ABC-type transport system involved in multi-copper enzyme maturation permease subunit
MSDPLPRPSPRRETASVGEVVEFVRDYAIQETVGPLKGAGRWIGYGAGGAALLGLGLMLIMLGLLRLIQSEWDGVAEGGSSWIPYAIVLIVTVVLIVVTLMRINKTYLNKETK